MKLSPNANRPYMPGYGILPPDQGRGLLPWNWAVERLKQTRTYLVSTTRPDGRPHTMPVWGVWLEDAFYFSTGQQSRKARNLAANPACTVTAGTGDEIVILEGAAILASDPQVVRRFADAYGPKYNWNMDGFSEPVYVVHPQTAFAFISSGGEFSGSATRWTF